MKSTLVTDMHTLLLVSFFISLLRLLPARQNLEERKKDPLFLTAAFRTWALHDEEISCPIC